jgi:hypothetical protein
MLSQNHAHVIRSRHLPDSSQARGCALEDTHHLHGIVQPLCVRLSLWNHLEGLEGLPPHSKAKVTSFATTRSGWPKDTLPVVIPRRSSQWT